MVILYPGTERTVIAFNDARGRKWRQIAAVIRKAKALAEAEAQARPPSRKCRDIALLH